MDILIQEHDLGNTRGYYINIDGIRIITINSKLSSDYKYHIKHHELGHAVLHPKQNSIFLKSSTLVRVGLMEEEADMFSFILQNYMIEGFNNLNILAKMELYQQWKLCLLTKFETPYSYEWEKNIN